MNKIRFGLGILLLLLLPVASSASGPSAHPMDFSTIGISAFASYWDAGALGGSIGGALAFRWEPIPYLGVGLRGGYFEKFDPDIENQKIDGLKVEMTPFEADIIGIWPIEEHLKIYAGGGAGVLFIRGHIKSKALAGGYEEFEFDNELSLFGLIGINWEFSQNLWFLAEARYTIADAEFTLRRYSDRGSYTADLDGPAINLGFVFGF